MNVNRMRTFTGPKPNHSGNQIGETGTIPEESSRGSRQQVPGKEVDQAAATEMEAEVMVKDMGNLRGLGLANYVVRLQLEIGPETRVKPSSATLVSELEIVLEWERRIGVRGGDQCAKRTGRVPHVCGNEMFSLIRVTIEQASGSRVGSY
jgi:hypothetical protein